MIYLRATDERHREIAGTLSAMAKAEPKGRRRSGTRRARKRKKIRERREPRPELHF
ncbi:hypothetical protein [Actinomadura madurae]|uniref:hypothetical protein n=1 Tax=Actinomadura madurae TaxID=1993 RepID=UPI00040E6938|nr:hypothetical protein [Actinomadura madurae]